MEQDGNDVRARLVRRSTALRALRRVLDDQGFVEVDTPILVPGPGLEPHIDPLSCLVRPGADAAPLRRFLITSPELSMKRLLAKGASRIYQLGHVFRDGEATKRHAPEFAMLEWYRAPGTLDEIVDDTAALIGAVARALTGGALLSSEAYGTIDVAPPFPRVSVVDAFARFAGVDLLDALRRTADGDADALPAAARRAGFALRPGADFEDAFFQVMADAVEPAIGRDKPCVLERWPAQTAVLARRCDDEPLLAARFELYAGGLELCNAFDELTDPVEQRARFLQDNRARRALGKEELPIDEDFLADLPALPRSAGNALGVDRVLMLVLGASRIDDVVAMPFR